jgi:hypothetical protein
VNGRRTIVVLRREAMGMIGAVALGTLGILIFLSDKFVSFSLF